MDFKKAQNEQRKLASKVIVKDAFPTIGLVGGAEAYSVGTSITACAVVCDVKTFEVKETSFAKGVSSSEFLPEFRAFREGPLLGEAITGLSLKPDLMIFSGEGLMHPRRCGLASHLGVLFDIPSIGVSKEILFGEQKGESVVLDKGKVGMMVKTRDHANPLVVSVGHRVSLLTASSFVKSWTREPHKMPEPLHLAHKFAKKHFKGEDK
jgi:deoxyribonuclease V